MSGRGIQGIGAGLSGYTAELASVMLGFELGITPTLLDGHAGYIAHWAKLLQARPHALLEAAWHAQKAADHLLAYGRAEQGQGG